MLNKKAQIADTMTWVVATLVVIFVLGILVFATIGISGSKPIFLEDKKKDFIATKSITSFLRNQDNVDLLESNKEEQIESKMTEFLEILPKPDTFWFWLPNSNPSYKIGDGGGWNIELDRNSKSKIRIYQYKIIPSIFLASDFKTTFNSNEIKLKFWVECSLDQCR
tara:strand:+ start:2235 stop:2732 length:498 start_codon:yes stop_codon:yes gene_type:complete